MMEVPDKQRARSGAMHIGRLCNRVASILLLLLEAELLVPGDMSRGLERG